MSAKTAATFVLGFAMGMLCLGVALWATGNLRAPSTTAATAASAPPSKQQPIAPLPLDLNAMTAEAKKVPPPVVREPSPAPVVGEADRAMPEPPTFPKASSSSLPHLAMPLADIDAKTLSSTFEDKRDGHRHEALDIPAPKGTPVHAVAEGNVAKLFTSKEGGLTVYQFDNTQTFCYYYAHLDRYAPGLAQGTLLRKGDVLGYVGTTGNASAKAPHLHFAVFRLNADKKWWQGTAIDPLPMLR